MGLLQPPTCHSPLKASERQAVCSSVLVQTRTPSNLIQQGTVDEKLATTAEPHDQQDVEAVDQVQTKAEGMIEGGDEEDSFSKIFADAENYDWTEAYESSQDEGQKGPNGREGESDDKDAPLSKDLSPAPQRLTIRQIRQARDDWPEYHETIALGLPTYRVNREMDLPELRASLVQWNAKKGENTGSFENLYSLEDEPSLLIICSRLSGETGKHVEGAGKVQADIHPTSREVVLTELMPQLKPNEIVDLIGLVNQLT